MVTTDIPGSLKWLHNELVDPCFIAVHSESRNGTSGSWISNVHNLQPFKSIVDPLHNGIYWHKDDLRSFYGEVWAYDESHVYLRQETFPHWPPPFDPPGSPWDIRPDKFRLFSSGAPQEMLPGGMGRVLAPVLFDINWAHAGNMSTHLCRDWSDFKVGNCSMYQADFLDHRVTVHQFAGEFSTVFDGELCDDPQGVFKASDDMRSCEYLFA